MSTYSVVSEPTTVSAKPGGVVYLENPLNRADVLDITLDWAAWLDDSGETISSVAWSAENGLSSSGESSTSTTASTSLTAGNVTGRRRIECQITTSGSQKRSVVIVADITNLSPWD